MCAIVCLGLISRIWVEGLDVWSVGRVASRLGLFGLIDWPFSAGCLAGDRKRGQVRLRMVLVRNTSGLGWDILRVLFVGRQVGRCGLVGGLDVEFD